MGEGYAWLAGLKEVRNITWVDLPTSHWPMWSRPKELAEIIGYAPGEGTRQRRRDRSRPMHHREALLGRAVAGPPMSPSNV